MLRREVARVLAALRKPETVLEILDVKVVAFESAERFRMKNLKNDVRSAHENSERRYDSAKPYESLVSQGRIILILVANHICEE
jgi:hypothetical protein